MSNTTQRRIVAVGIRAARLGYAVFDQSEELVDFGAAWFDSEETERLRIATLLRRFHPSILVLGKRGRGDTRRYDVWQKVERIVRSEAKKLSITVAWLTEQEFKLYFRNQSCGNKHDIAAHVAVRFPDVSWRLPPRRKFYQPEPRSMLYFDSIALGIVYLDLCRKTVQ